MDAFEKLGAFYLGKEYDQARRAVTDSLLLYDSRDLTTNAVCVGMTGSGKTGLCLSLLEEAAIDGVPTLAIDPKGDLGNLLLAFPGLEPRDFLPWIDAGEAERKGKTPEAYAAAVAETWRRGLADWGQDGTRIARYRDSVDLAIYTPGSSAGLPLTVLRSFAAPSQALREDGDAFRDRVTSAVSGLLALLGVDADPLRSREHILVASILSRHWEEGTDLDLPDLIRNIQKPPFDRIGIMDLDTFYPASDRASLAMSLNSLLASPGFASWMEGEPLEIPRLLWTEDGKPRVSILSIAHLSEAERMFFVTLVLNEVLAWIRTQSGTSSLRALLYMDEIFGYFPPTANPPSKQPMLTLLKQGRAYGLGTVLTTQNPVDLDYKGLSNTGTWFLGRLQTERDKARVLEGLEGASTTAGADFDRRRFDALLSGLDSRVFLMQNVHEKEPVLFHTRWALSYLRGPLTRTQIRELMAPRKDAGERPDPATAPGGKASPAPVSSAVRAEPAPDAVSAAPPPAASEGPPALPPEIRAYFQQPPPAAGERAYRPVLLGRTGLHYVKARGDVDHWTDAVVLAPLTDDTLSDPWDAAWAPPAPLDLGEQAPPGRFAQLPGPALNPKRYATWKKKLVTYLYRNRPLILWNSPALELTSEPGETKGAFRVRLGQAAREERDATLARLEASYRPKLTRIRERILRAQEKLAREEEQYRHQQVQTAVSLGATVLGAMFGRKAVSTGTVGRATTAARGMGRAAREKGDVARAREKIAQEQQRLAELEADFRREIETVPDPAGAVALDLKEVRIPPRKTDMSDATVDLAWILETP